MEQIHDSSNTISVQINQQPLEQAKKDEINSISYTIKFKNEKWKRFFSMEPLAIQNNGKTNADDILQAVQNYFGDHPLIFYKVVKVAICLEKLLHIVIFNPVTLNSAYFVVLVMGIIEIVTFLTKFKFQYLSYSICFLLSHISTLFVLSFMEENIQEELFLLEIIMLISNVIFLTNYQRY